MPGWAIRCCPHHVLCSKGLSLGLLLATFQNHEFGMLNQSHEFSVLKLNPVNKVKGWRRQEDCKWCPRRTSNISSALIWRFCPMVHMELCSWKVLLRHIVIALKCES